MNANPQSTLDLLREERRTAVERMLVIECELAESKRDWLENKGGLPLPARAALEAEFAQLKLRRYHLNIGIKAAEKLIAPDPLAAVKRAVHDYHHALDKRQHGGAAAGAADDGVDVSEIAKEYGGGGHAKAAGFKVPRGHSLAMA